MTTQRVTPKVITEEESLNDVLHHVLYAIMTNFFYLSIFLFNFSSLFRHHPNCSCLISIWKLVTTCTCDASSRHDSECIEETGLVQERWQQSEGRSSRSCRSWSINNLRNPRNIVLDTEAWIILVCFSEKCRCWSTNQLLFDVIANSRIKIVLSVFVTDYWFRFFLFLRIVVLLWKKWNTMLLRGTMTTLYLRNMSQEG